MVSINKLLEVSDTVSREVPDFRDGEIIAQHDQIWLPAEWDDLSEAAQKKILLPGGFESEGAVSFFT